MAVTENKRRRHRATPLLHRRAPLAGALSAAVALACAQQAHALEWRFQPSLDASATYTDNVRQSANDPEDAIILRATPGFLLRSEGSSRVQASLQYGLSGVARYGGGDQTDVYHSLNGTGKAELIEDFLFIDGTARVSQELISLQGSLADADSNSSNRATVGTYSISPYVVKRLGTFATAQARYTASGAIFENDVAANSNVNSFTAGLTSGSQFNDLSWGLNYSIRKAENRNAGDSTFESASAQLGYALTRKFRVFGTLGQDWNEYLSATGTDGSFYSVGFGWAPTRRTSIEASTGERYFGRTYGLSGRHRTKASNWSLSYSEDVSDTSKLLPTSGTVFNYLCPLSSGDLLLITDWPYTTPPSPECVAFGGTPGLVFDLRNGVFISKTLRAGVSWGIRKVTYSLNFSDLKRLYTADNTEDQTQSLGVTVAYRMTPKTTANGSITFTRLQVPASSTLTARDDDYMVLSLGLNHRFADKLTGALIFRHAQRDSNVASSDYEENSITASVNMRF